jgi:hypothetical protein
MWLSRCCCYGSAGYYPWGGTTCGHCEPVSAVSQGAAAAVEEPPVAPAVEVPPPPEK